MEDFHHSEKWQLDFMSRPHHIVAALLGVGTKPAGSGGEWCRPQWPSSSCSCISIAWLSISSCTGSCCNPGAGLGLSYTPEGWEEDSPWSCSTSLCYSWDVLSAGNARLNFVKKVGCGSGQTPHELSCIFSCLGMTNSFELWFLSITKPQNNVYFEKILTGFL